MPENTHLPPSDDRELDLLELLKPLRQRWARFLTLWMLFVVIGLLFVGLKQPRFSSLGSLYVEEPQDGLDTAAMTALMPMISGSSNVESEAELLRSRDLSRKVIRKLGLNARLTGPAEYLPAEPRYWNWRLDRDPRRFSRGLHAHDTLVDPQVFAPIDFVVTFDDATRFTVVSDQTPPVAGRLGKVVDTSRARFVLDYQGGEPLGPGVEMTVTLLPAEAVIKRFQQSLGVSATGGVARSSNLIRLSYTHTSPYTAATVVETLVDEFIQLKQRWATTVSRKTLQFVTTQIDELQLEMNNAAARLSKFQSETGLVSLDPQVKAELDSLVDYEIQLKQQQMRVNELEQLAESLMTDQPDFYVMAFVPDPLIQEMGKRLAELNAEIASLESQFHSDYPQLTQLRVSRRALQKDLQSMVVNYLSRAKAQQGELAQAVAQYQERLSTLPEQAKALTDFLRSTKVFEDLYLLLAQERQKAKIAEASTLSNLRVVDRPTVPLEPSSPQPLIAIGVSAGLGLLLAGLIVVVPALRINWFTSVEEIKNHFASPIFTVMPHRGRDIGRALPEILETSTHSPFIESIRLLRANLLHTMAGKKQQAILITSAMPKDGKTSVAANLACTMAKSERVRRVLLIDADMHNPTMHSVFTLSQTPGLSNYLNGEASIEQIIRTVPLPRGGEVDVIVGGPTPPTPVDLVETDAMQELIDYARQKYTFTILDTPPYPLTTTASVLATKVDRILAVCRVGSTDRAIFKRHVDELSELTKQFGLVINTDAPVDGYGGYGYGYGYTNGNGHEDDNGANGSTRVAGTEGAQGRIKRLLTKT